MKNKINKIMISSILIGTALFSNNIKVSDTESLKKRIVIFSGGAFFDEEKSISNIKKGNNTIVYNNISPNLIKGSVVVELDSGNKINEQNYKFNTVSFYEVLKHNIGNSITFKNYKYNNKEFVLSKGILLSSSPTIMVQNDDGIFNINKNDVIFDKLPIGIQLKPSIEWKLNSKRNIKNGKIKLNYLSTGFTWDANYIINIKNNKSTLTGWIKLHNNSKISLKNYNLELLAGTVNNVTNNNRNNYVRSIRKNKIMMSDSIEEVSEKSFSGYHIYNIPFKVDIDKNSIKEINFLTKNINNFDRYNELTLDTYLNSKKIFKFKQKIRIINNEKSGINEPLPKGLIRVYESDKNNNKYFIGSDTIKDIPKNEKMILTIGENFDSVLEFDPILRLNNNNYNNNHKILENRFEIRNNSNKIENYEVNIVLPNFDEKIKHTINNSNKGKYTSSSNQRYTTFLSNCNEYKNCKHTIVNNKLVKFSITLKPKQKIEIQYKTEYKLK